MNWFKYIFARQFKQSMGYVLLNTWISPWIKFKKLLYSLKIKISQSIPQQQTLYMYYS